MKLATKLVTVFMVLVLLGIAVDAYLAAREESELHELFEQRDVARLGTTLRMAMQHEAEQPAILELIEELNATAGFLQVRWVWFEGASEERHRPRGNISRAQLEQDEDAIVYPVEVPDRNLRLAYVYVPMSVGQMGGVEVETDPERLQQLRTHQLVRGLRVAGLSILLSAIVAVFFGNRLIARPLGALVEKTRRIGAGDLSTPVQVRGRDELSTLGAAINTMCEQLEQSRQEAASEAARRVETLEQLRHADRLSTVGQLASGIGHELGTPLNVISGQAEMIAGGRLPAERIAESAVTIKDQAQRIAKTIRQVLDFARANSASKSQVDLRVVIDQTVALLSPMAGKVGVTIDQPTVDGPLVAMIDPGQVQQVLSNLLVNAIQAMPGGGTITLRARQTNAPSPHDPEARTQPCLVVEVEDEGHGIDPQDLERLFDPFFTTKAVGEGTGLGLSVAYGIAREHGGWIAVSSEPQRGSCFRFYLPVEQRP